MRQEVQPFDLGQDGLAYVKNWYEGWGTLSSYAESFLEKAKHAVVFAPADTSRAQLETLKQWEFLDGYRQFVEAATYRHLTDILPSNENYALIVFDFVLRSDDSHAADYGPTFYFEEYTYNYLNGSKFSKESIHETLNTLAEPAMGFFVEGTIDEKTAFQQTIGKDVFDRLLSRIRVMTLTVYDGAGEMLIY